MISHLLRCRRNYTIEMIEDASNTCQCKCHFGGAVSCPSCKINHEEKIHCDHCSRD